MNKTQTLVTLAATFCVGGVVAIMGVGPDIQEDVMTTARDAVDEQVELCWTNRNSKVVASDQERLVEHVQDELELYCLEECGASVKVHRARGCYAEVDVTVTAPDGSKERARCAAYMRPGVPACEGVDGGVCDTDVWTTIGCTERRARTRSKPKWKIW